MRKPEIENHVEQVDLFANVDIKEVAKEAKLGWIIIQILIKVWPKIRAILVKKQKTGLVDVIDLIVNGQRN